MNSPERPVVFPCGDETLVGILHPGGPAPEIGVVMIVGGPQYRVGSHRSFVRMARKIAAAGTPVLRFDARGMGDSSGSWPGFENTGPDIDAAIDCLCRCVPTLNGVMLAGLCDGASASALYAPHSAKVAGLILINPWIRSDNQLHEFGMRNYYLPRLRETARWKRLIRGQIDVRSWIRESRALLRRAVSVGLGRLRGDAAQEDGLAFRLCASLARFGRPVLVLISGDDMVGREFEEYWKSPANQSQRQASDDLVIRVFAGAKHTIPVRRDLEMVTDECVSWLTDRSDRWQPSDERL